MQPSASAGGDDSSPVQDTETLLRRFPSDPGQLEKDLKTPRFAIFVPSPTDVDGLSLNREGPLFVRDPEALLILAKNENIRIYGGVIAVLTGNVRARSMTVDPDPGDTPGHVIIPELNRTEYDSSRDGKRRVQDLAIRLASEAAKVRVYPKPKPAK